MADISTGMKVTGLSQYKNAMQQAQQSVKTLDAQLKKTEAQYKATGDKEQYMSDKSDTLKKKLNEQQKAAAQAQKALDAMRAQGVDPASRSFQQMEQQLLKAQTGVLQTTAEINNLNASEQAAAKGADQLTTSVNGISKKISLDQVISGVNSITSGLENAAKKAVALGETIFNAVMDKAKWADDTATMAMMYGIDLDTFLRMQKLVTNGMDTSVESMLSAQSRLKRNLGSDSKEVNEAMKTLGVTFRTVVGEWEFGKIVRASDSLEAFWEVGQKVMALGDENKQEDMAQKLFGRSWKELVPLFSSFKTVEDYRNALDGVNVSSEEDVNALAELNDRVSELKGNLDTLSTDILATLAPALTSAAKALSGLLSELIAYLKTEDGQKMLDSLSESVSSLFDDLGKIDPESVIQNFTNVFNAVIDAFKWLVDNKDNIVHALEGVVIGWAGLKLTGGALQIYQMISGIKGLTGANLGSVVNRIFGNGSPGAPTHSAADIASAMAQTVQTLIGGTIGGVALGDFIDDFMNFNHAESIDDLRKKVWERFNLPEDKLPIPVEPEVQENAAEDVARQVGVVTLPAKFAIMGGGIGLGGGGENLSMVDSSRPLYTHANGLPFVPWDGYIAMLHRGERVLTASANRSYTANSNLYVENMNMNNGMDAQALAAAMNAQNQRIRSGFGS